MLTFENASIDGNTVVALGNFDGLHIGHRRVLDTALEVAGKKNLVPVALLFDEHPKTLVCGKRPPILMTDEMRDEKLEQMGFSVVKMSFSAFRGLEPEAFISKIYRHLNVRTICCGFNYHYGINGTGDVASLERDCRKLSVPVLWQKAAYYEGAPISATRIRKEIEKGNIKAANAMLGRPFSYKMTVVAGDKRGRLLGYPTINQFFPEGFVTPRFGVYASKVRLGEKWYPAVTNIGIRPTINTKTMRSETNIIGFSGDLYGEDIEVFLLEFVRDEKKFDDLKQLAYTISCDAETAFKIYSEREGEADEKA